MKILKQLVKIIYEDGENACFLRAPFTVELLELATTIGLQQAFRSRKQGPRCLWASLQKL